MFGLAEDKLDDDDLLQDEDIFEGPVTPGQVPELREDTKIIATLESNLKSIEYLLQDIRTSGGVSRDIALEAANYTDNLPNPNLYTKDPTASYLTVTNESLWDSIKKGFKSILETIKEWIRKTIAWLVGLYKDKINDKDYSLAKHKVDITEEQNTKAWEYIISQLGQAIEYNKTIENNPRFVSEVIPNGEIPLLNQLAMRVSQVRPNTPVHSILTQRDPFVYDIVYMGPYIRLINELSGQLKHVCMQLNIKAKLLEEVFDNEFNHPHDSAARTISAGKLSNVNEPVLLRIENRTTPLDEAIARVNSERGKVKDLGRSEPVSYAELVLRLYSNLTELNIVNLQRDVFDSTRMLIEVEEKLNSLTLKENKIDYGDFYVKGNEQLISNLRIGLSKLASYTNLATILMRYIKSTTDYIFFIDKEVIHHTNNMVDWLITEGRKLKVTVPDSLINDMRRINRDRNRNYAEFKKYRAGKVN